MNLSGHFRNLMGAGSMPSRLTFGQIAILLGILTLIPASRSHAQAAPAEVGGLEMVTLGGTFSAYRVNYGDRLLLGAAIYMDIDYNQHYGIEAEGRWLWLNERDSVRNATYLIGPRYSFNGIGDDRKKFRPYVKFMVGVADFQFPYHYADGEYFILAPGGGVDFRVSRLVRLRLIDAEYQLWPQFTYGAFSSLGISSGLRFRVF